jgi:hypothetical protein
MAMIRDVSVGIGGNVKHPGNADYQGDANHRVEFEGEVFLVSYVPKLDRHGALLLTTTTLPGNIIITRINMGGHEFIVGTWESYKRS